MACVVARLHDSRERSRGLSTRAGCVGRQSETRTLHVRNARAATRSERGALGCSFGISDLARHQ